MDVWILVALVVAALAAGWVDAVVGGGGLLLLPVLLFVPGIEPVEALGTNKSVAIAGTTMSAVTYYRSVRPDLRTALTTALLAVPFAAGGALVAAVIPGASLKPVILVALVAAALYTLLRPNMGSVTSLRFAARRHGLLAAVAGAAIGFYDGIAGPGTGAFLLFILVGGLGYAFLEGSANAKIINVGTNLGALVVFALAGSVLWAIAPFMAAANVLGGYLGARTAVTAGSNFVRRVFLIIVAVLILRLAWDVAEPLVR